ncbi:MAG: hypothetical protein WBM69_04135 [Desulfobacterales bacterium]
MKLDPAFILSPPWSSIAAWQEANISIDYHLKRYCPRLKPAMQIARKTRIRLESIFPCLDDLGQMTCPRCPDACCLSASPWYDLRDLIFLHLNQLSIPLTQTISGFKETCRYISRKGCTLPRITRPWICTWYLCPAQTANVKDRNPNQWQTLSRVLGEIKACRKKLEDEFIRVII